MYKKIYFNYKKFKNKYLLTNDLGNFIFLNDKEFKTFMNNEPLPKRITTELENKQFIFENESQEFVKFHYQKLHEYKEYLDYGTVLHIFVVSKNCNFNCIYCQAGNLNQNEKMIMDEETAKRAVNIALEAPSKFLTFEFQGGEPLTNFEIIKFIVKYSKLKNKDKEIEYVIVSNLSLLTNDMVQFIKENNISVCTSIDGNRKMQNINRPYINGDSYNATIGKMKLLLSNEIPVSALLTTSKFSLKEYKSIVDEYVNLGLDKITIRPLTRLGKADANWEKIGYTAEDFIEFYKNILNYIIQKNKKGYFLVEGMASILLSKILKAKSINYMELRSPCGGAIGQLAYYYDGDVYTCDEGRMLAEMGDKKFLLGNVYESNYDKLIQHECTKEMCQSSCLEVIPFCHSCVYMPYCGTCPVINYAQTGSMVRTCKDEYKCEIMKGIMDVLFDYIENDKSVLEIFEMWC